MFRVKASARALQLKAQLQSVLSGVADESEREAMRQAFLMSIDGNGDAGNGKDDEDESDEDDEDEEEGDDENSDGNSKSEADGSDADRESDNGGDGGVRRRRKKGKRSKRDSNAEDSTSGAMPKAKAKKEKKVKEWRPRELSEDELAGLQAVLEGAEDEDERAALTEAYMLSLGGADDDDDEGSDEESEDEDENEDDEDDANGGEKKSPHTRAKKGRKASTSKAKPLPPLRTLEELNADERQVLDEMLADVSEAADRDVLIQAYLVSLQQHGNDDDEEEETKPAGGESSEAAAVEDSDAYDSKSADKSRETALTARETEMSDGSALAPLPDLIALQQLAATTLRLSLSGQGPPDGPVAKAMAVANAALGAAAQAVSGANNAIAAVNAMISAAVASVQARSPFPSPRAPAPNGKISLQPIPEDQGSSKNAPLFKALAEVCSLLLFCILQCFTL